jgi:hypothetical protein
MSEYEKYDAFEKKMHEKYPAMFAEPYGGFCVGEGWWPILEALCGNIQSHIDWKFRKDPIPQVVVHQIKEKFGGLRFYYEGGDEAIQGMVTMAESWAYRSCETCGKPGKPSTSGWIKVACEEHARVG